MSGQQGEIERFFEEVGRIRQDRQQRLREHPNEENQRRRWADFRHVVERDWLPILEEYLTALGKLWFGEEMRLSGSIYQKKLVSCPAYIVAHEVFGPMLVFWVVENTWQERELPYIDKDGTPVLRTELFKRGYRCRAVIEDGEQCQFQGDDLKTLIELNLNAQIDQERLAEVFAEAYLKGPRVVFSQWKDWSAETKMSKSEDEAGKSAQ